MKMEAVRADQMEQGKHGLSPRGARRPSFMKYPSLPMKGAGKTGCWLHPWNA